MILTGGKNIVENIIVEVMVVKPQNKQYVTKRAAVKNSNSKNDLMWLIISHRILMEIIRNPYLICHTNLVFMCY